MNDATNGLERDGRAGAAAGWREVAAAWIRLPHPLAILLVLIATAGFAILFSGGTVGGATLGAMLLAMLGGQLAIGAVNEIVDEPLDRVAKPQKPIPSGLVSVRAAWGLAIGGLVVMVLFGSGFGIVPLLLLCAGTGLGLAYDLWFKQGAFGWLPYVLALPLLPIWVQSCVSGFDPRLLLLYPLAAPATAGVYLAQSAPDAESDRMAGLGNLGARLGSRRMAWLACLLVMVTPLLALAVAAIAPSLGVDLRRLSVAAAVSAGCVVAAAAMVLRRPVVGIRRCFAPLAVALLISGFGWLASLSG